MADPEKEHPSLELPKLGGLRGRSRRERPRASAAEPAEDTRPIVLVEPEPEPEPEPEFEPRRRTRRTSGRERGPGGMVAAVVTGLVVGLGIVGLTWASLRACEGIQGTSSCGGLGYPLLGLILLVMVVVGALLLRLARVVDPGTTSFLGVGLAVVVALLVLVDHLMDRSMVVVVPLVCAVTFALAHGVTRTFIEPPRD